MIKSKNPTDGKTRQKETMVKKENQENKHKLQKQTKVPDDNNKKVKVTDKSRKKDSPTKQLKKANTLSRESRSKIWLVEEMRGNTLKELESPEKMWQSDDEEIHFEDDVEEDKEHDDGMVKDEVADIIDLVRSDDYESLSEGFEKFGPEISAKLCVDSDKRGLSPLTLAAEMNRIDILRLMIEQGLDLDVPNSLGNWTALHSASSQGHTEVVRLLVGAGAGVDIGDRDGWTSLHFSSENGYLETTKILVEAGSDINSPTSAEHYTPLFLACQSGHLDLVSWFLKRGVSLEQRDKDGWTPFHAACSRNHIEVVEFLITETEGVKKLVNSKTAEGITPLYLASQHGYTQLVKLLIGKGAESNVLENEGFAPIHVACQGGHLEVVSELIGSSESDVNLVAKNETSWRPIHFATQENRADIIDLLIKKSAKVDATSSHGHIALQLAAGSGYIECLKILLSRGHADPTTTDYLGWCPLHHATQNGHIGVVRELIEFHKSTKGDSETKDLVNIKTKEGDTCLLIAVLNDHLSIAELLIENGASLNAEDLIDDQRFGKDSHFCEFVLHAACEIGNPSMISLLVEHGEKVDAKDDRGWTPLHCLSETNNVEGIDILLSNIVSTLEHVESEASPKKIPRKISKVQKTESITPEESSISDGDLTPFEVFPLPYMSNFSPLKDYCSNNRQLLSSDSHENSYQYILDAQTSDGHTPLILASHCGHLETVKCLLKLGARADIVDYQGWSALHAASAKGHTEVVKSILISSGLDVNRRTYHGFTSLYLSIQERHAKTVEYLLNEALSNPNISENQGSCPLHVAAQNGLVDVIESLMKSGALSNKADTSGWTALHFAVQDGNQSTVRKLIEHGSDVDAQTKDGITALFIAVHKNLDEIIELLLQQGARTDLYETTTGLTSLHLACDNGYFKTVQRLLLAGSNTEAETKYDQLRALDIAIRSKNISDDVVVETIVRALLSEGADPMPPSTSGLPGLHLASQKGMTGVVQALIEHGADVDSLDEAGWTPLMFASRSGKGKTVNALLHAGAKPENTKGEYKNSKKVDALILAVQNGHIDVVETLILWSCNINTSTFEGTTALYCASQHGDLEMLQMLLFNGADPNLEDIKGFIPLHPACLNGHKKVAESLVKAGSSVDHAAKDGSRPVQFAYRNGHEEIVEWLLTEGANHPGDENIGLTRGATLVSGWGAYIKNVLVKAYRHGMDEYARISGEDETSGTAESEGRRYDTLQRDAAVEKMSLEKGKSKGRQKSFSDGNSREIQKM